MTGIIKTDKIQSPAGNDAVTVASNGSITTAGITSTTGTFSGNVISQGNVNAAGSGTAGGFHFADGNAMIYRDGNDMSFKLQGAQKIRLLSGGGLTFNGDTAAANALDDYEEGTWTPSDQSGAGMSLTVYEAFYTKIGRKVYVEIGFKIPSNSSTADVSIGGLPFTAKSGNDNTGGFARVGGNSGRDDQWQVGRGVILFGASTNSGVSGKNNEYSDKQIKLCGSYTVA